MSAYDFDLHSNCLPDSVPLKVMYYSGLHAQISEWICIVSESASLVAQLVKNPPAMWETWVWSLGWEDLLEKGKAAHSLYLGFLCGSAGKESACNVGDLGLILGLGRSPGEGKGYPLQYSGLENSMDCIVHQMAKSWTQLKWLSMHSCTHKVLFSGDQINLSLHGWVWKE